MVSRPLQKPSVFVTLVVKTVLPLEEAMTFLTMVLIEAGLHLDQDIHLSPRMRSPCLEASTVDTRPLVLRLLTAQDPRTTTIEILTTFPLRLCIIHLCHLRVAMGATGGTRLLEEEG